MMHGPINIRFTWIYVNLFHNHLHKNIWCNSAYSAILYGSIKSRCVQTLLINYCDPNVEKKKTILENEIIPLRRCLYNDIYNCASMLNYAAVNKLKSGTFSLAASHKIVISWYDCKQIRHIILLISN